MEGSGGHEAGPSKCHAFNPQRQIPGANTNRQSHMDPIPPSHILTSTPTPPQRIRTRNLKLVPVSCQRNLQTSMNPNHPPAPRSWIQQPQSHKRSLRAHPRLAAQHPTPSPYKILCITHRSLPKPQKKRLGCCWSKAPGRTRRR